MKKRIRPISYRIFTIIYLLSTVFVLQLKAQEYPMLSKENSIMMKSSSEEALQWQTNYSLMAEVCKASAGVIVTNMEGECLTEKKLIASTQDTHQTAEGYTLHYILWDVSNPNFPRFKGINTTGVFEAPLETKTYQIYAYSELTEDAPIPSPITLPNTPVAAIGEDYPGCFQVVSTQTFKVLGTFRLESVTDVPNSNVHIYEICGGELPYEYEFSSSEGFANITEHPGSTVHCRKVRLFYGLGASWEFTVTDANECENTLSYSSAESLFPIIMGFDVKPETCPDDADGSISVNVQGGVKCESPELPYSYIWEGPNGYTNEGAEIIDLKSGTYKVTVTDCIGNTTTAEAKVQRNNGNLGGRATRRGCRGAIGKTALENTAIEWIEVYPNPISQQGFVEFILKQNTPIEARILDLNGQEITHLYSGDAEAGTVQRIPFTVENLPQGLYLLQLQGNDGWQYIEKLQVVK